jgi:hypothetical protein
VAVLWPSRVCSTFTLAPALIGQGCAGVAQIMGADGRWKTAEMCIGLFDARQQARHKWIASGPRRGREEAHATAVVTYHASPVRSLTVKVCLSCLWISRNLDEVHP